MNEKEPVFITPDHLPPSIPSVPTEFSDNDSIELQESDTILEESIRFDTLGLKSLKQILESGKR